MTSIDFLPLFDGRSACVIGEGPLAVTIQGAFAGRGARLVSEAVAEADVWPDITSIIIDNMPLYERTMSNLGRMFVLARRFGDRRLAQRTVVIILRHDPAKATATVALCQMARSFACELGRVGGRVNLILHGDLATSCQPDDVAAGCLFLTSDLASYVTGIILPIGLKPSQQGVWND
jgi:NAD(P)-dependent dehydrogenase (short-subunit alcohol dehydrogenase family)